MVPAATRCYAWNTRAARETIAPSAHPPRARMIVTESGAARGAAPRLL